MEGAILMRKPVLTILIADVLLLALVPLLLQLGPASQFHVMAQSAFPNPANEHACPSQTGAGGGAEAIPAFVGSGSDGFSPNQSLCLPQLAPVPTGLSPLAFIVQGLEPGDRVDSQGMIYVESIRGVPGGVDLWRWSQPIEGAPNANGTLPFKYEGQPDNCGIFGLTGGGCVNNVGSPTNLGVAPGGGDADIAVNAPDPNNSAIPNVALTSLALVPGVTATNSRNRGDTFFTPPNVLSAQVAGDDRMWNDAPDDPSTVYMSYHDVTTFNIEVQRSNNGGLTYLAGAANIFPALAVDNFGNVYTVWSDNQNIFLSSSSDLGNTWTSPVRVNRDGTVGKSNVFPWIAADAYGHVVVTWLGSSLPGNSNDVAAMQPACADGTTNCWAQWSVYAAESVNGNAAVPSFTQRTASDHFIHAGTVCTNGTGCSNGDSRALADFFQVALDTQHRANVAFADDHLASPLCSQQSPGHCANNDPQTFRVAVPYFTYQLKPTKHIVTTGLCAR